MLTAAHEPTYSHAVELVDEAVRRRTTKAPQGFDSKTWRAHVFGVAENAFLIASRLPGMNPDRARLMGLLHDIGKRWGETTENTFHGLSGYYYMKAFGYDDIARICLTHSFIIKDSPDNLLPNPDRLVIEACALLKNIDYDDYDLLLQLCDWLNDCGIKCTIDFRTDSILKRYPAFDPARTLHTVKAVKELKSRFDKKCGIDIYTLLGINP